MKINKEKYLLEIVTTYHSPPEGLGEIAKLVINVLLPHVDQE